VQKDDSREWTRSLRPRQIALDRVARPGAGEIHPFVRLAGSAAGQEREQSRGGEPWVKETAQGAPLKTAKVGQWGIGTDSSSRPILSDPIDVQVWARGRFPPSEIRLRA
jgi:hypothetical protein